MQDVLLMLLWSLKSVSKFIIDTFVTTVRYVFDGREALLHIRRMSA